MNDGGKNTLFPSLAKGVSWTGMGAIAQAGYQWGVVVILARLCDPVAVGQYAWALAIVTPILTFTNLQLRAVQTTDARNEFRLIDYLFVRGLGSVLGVIGIALAVAAFGVDRKAVAVVFLVAAAKIFESYSDVLYGLWQKNELLQLMGASRLFRALASLALVVTAVWYTRDVLAGAISLCVASAITLIGYDIRATIRRLPTFLHDQPCPSLGVIWQLVRACFPLGVVTALNAVLFNVPRYFVERLWGVTALAYYSAMSYLTLAGGIGVGAMSEAAMHRLAHSYAYDPREYERLVKRLLQVPIGLFALGLIVTYLCGETILTFIYGASYATEKDAFLWLMVAAGIMYVVQSLGSSITAARYFRVQVLMSLAGVAVNIALCAYLVPRARLVGAGWASSGSHLTLLVIALAITVRAFREGRRRQQAVSSIGGPAR